MPEDSPNAVQQKKQKVIKYLKRRRTLIENVALILILLILVQLVFWEGRSGFFHEVNGLSVSYKSRSAIAEELNKHFDHANVTITAQNKEYNVSLDTMGVQPDIAQISKSAVEYPIWQRLIPFSFLTRVVPSNTEIIPIVDQEKLDAFVSIISSENNLQPKDASLIYDKGKITLSEAKSGYKYEPENIKNFFIHLQFSPGGKYKLEAIALSPKTTNEDAQKIILQAEYAINNPPKLVAENLVLTPDKNTIANILLISKNDSGPVLEVDDKKLESYLRDINEKYFTKATPITVTLLDGGEIARVDGVQGRGVELTKSKELVKQAILGADSKEINLPIAKIDPETAYRRIYTATQKGLQTLVSDIVTENGDFAISVQEIAGGTRQASSRGNVRYLAASTYKIFVAYYLIKQVEENKIAWNDVLENGKTVDKCFEDMIVQSDNPCAELLRSKFGTGQITKKLKSIGINNSGFDANGSFATADDETKFMHLLATGKLMNDIHKDKFISAMKSQIFRQGIPKGASGATVADKVGFLFGYINDTAVVYGPRSTYSITILSNNSSWSKIADTASRINKILN